MSLNLIEEFQIILSSKEKNPMMYFRYTEGFSPMYNSRHKNFTLQLWIASNGCVVMGTVTGKNKIPAKTGILAVKSRDGQIRTGDPLSPRQVL